MHCALMRERGEVRWFALCGVNFPASKWLPIRSLKVNRGPVCDDADLTLHGTHRLVEKSRELGFAYVEIAPDWVEHSDWIVGNALARDGWQLLEERRSSLRLDLSAGYDELLRSFRKGTRYEIQRSQRQGIVIRSARDENDLLEFERVYFAMAKKKNFPALAPSHLSHILRWIANEKDRGALLLAFKEEILLGGTLVVRAAKRSWYVLGATTKEESLSAGHLLQWHAIRWAKEHGCAEHDLGGYREGVNTGPALFKRGFCQTVVQFSPAYRYSLNQHLCSIVDLVTKARGARAK